MVADLSGENVDFSKAVTWPSECPKGSTYYLWAEDTVGSMGPASAHSPSHLSRRRSGTPGAVSFRPGLLLSLNRLAAQKAWHMSHDSGLLRWCPGGSLFSSLPNGDVSFAPLRKPYLPLNTARGGEGGARGPTATVCSSQIINRPVSTPLQHRAIWQWWHFGRRSWILSYFSIYFFIWVSE